MASFLKYFISTDAYGEPVQVKYKGDTSYKTELGAFITLAVRILILTFIAIGVIGLVGYEDPQITQYKVYNKRSEGPEISLGAAQGDIFFGFYNHKRFVVPDP